jgi:hypothetical protein
MNYFIRDGWFGFSFICLVLIRRTTVENFCFCWGLVLGWFFGLGLDFWLGCGWVRRKKAVLVFFRLAKGLLLCDLLGVLWL